jgi:hypothetical protein
LEIINIGNNPFVSQCDQFFKFSFIKYFFSIKIINNDDYTQSIFKKKAYKRKPKKIFSEGYFYIIQLQNFFLKYFNSFYFTNQILNQFTVNSILTEDNVALLNSIIQIFLILKQFIYKI